MKNVIVLIAFLMLIIVSYSCGYTDTDKSYQEGLRDGLDIGRTEAYQILKKTGGKGQADNYFVALKNAVISHKDLYYPLKIVVVKTERKSK